MSVIIPKEDFQKVIDLMKIKLPSEIQRAAQDAVAATAATGRKTEQKTATTLEGGKYQKTTGGETRDAHPKRYFKEGYFSEWSRAGWVSTTRKDSKGNPFRMASFAWERGKSKKKGKVGAFYTSQLANLWGQPTKPYKVASPFVGNKEGRKRWNPGDIRPVKYSWSKTDSYIRAATGEGIRRAEARLRERMGGEIK